MINRDWQSLHPLSDPDGEEQLAPGLVTYMTLNGWQFWPVSLPLDDQETDALRIRRVFLVKSPSGERHRCAVDVTTSVRELVRAEIGRDCPPHEEIWSVLCKSALSNSLWQKAETPPDTLVVYELDRKQVETVRQLAGIRTLGRF